MVSPTGISLEIADQISFETKFNAFILYTLYPTGFKKMVDSIQWIVQI
jgi:hypothetical protein